MIIRLLHYTVRPGMKEEYLMRFADIEARVPEMEGILFFGLFQDRNNPDAVFLAQVFADEQAVEHYGEMGASEEYIASVMPLIDRFTMAQQYSVSAARALVTPTQEFKG